MASTNTIKILIADDLRSSRLNIENLLRHWGYEPVACEDGLAARNALTAPNGPRIAILDWVMPGMSGPELCQWIDRELGSLVYTILLTSKSEQGDLIEGLGAGAHAYITKPARPAELQSWIRVGLRMLNYERELARKSEALHAYAREKEALAETLAHRLAEKSPGDALSGLGIGLGTEIRRTSGLLLERVRGLDLCWDQAQVAAGSHQPSPYPNLRDDAQQHLTALHQGLNHLKALAEYLETFNQPIQQTLGQRCQVNDVIRAALSLCGTSLGSSAQIRLALDPDLPEARTVPEILRRVVIQFLMGVCAGPPATVGLSTHRKAEGIALRLESSLSGASGIPGNPGLDADLDMLNQLGAFGGLETTPGGGPRLDLTLPVAPERR